MLNFMSVSGRCNKEELLFNVRFELTMKTTTTPAKYQYQVHQNRLHYKLLPKRHQCHIISVTLHYKTYQFNFLRRINVSCCLGKVPTDMKYPRHILKPKIEKLSSLHTYNVTSFIQSHTQYLCTYQLSDIPRILTRLNEYLTRKSTVVRMDCRVSGIY